MANIKRTKLVLRFNIGTEDAPKYKDVTYTRVAEEASMTTACPTWSASMKYPQGIKGRVSTHSCFR